MDQNRRSWELLFQAGQSRVEAFVGVLVVDLAGRKESFRQVIDKIVDPLHDWLELQREKKSGTMRKPSSWN